MEKIKKKRSALTSEEKLERIRLLEEKKKLQAHLPHIYGMKFYPWMRRYWESRNKHTLVCSANQIGKSSIQIRKAIEWATNQSLWNELWPSPLPTPRQFWYLYPSSYVATIEVEKKWMTEFLPRPELKDHPVYGWRADYRAKYIQAIHFNSGISIYFKTYSQSPEDLQAGSVSAIFTDEEIDSDLVPELQARLFATDGYFSAVFTPTMGQEYWREAIEAKGSKERFPEALKIQVSMFDCMLYEDGTPSFWSKERIQKIINQCKSEAEVQRRVYGKFVLDSGLKYQAFDPNKNLIDPFPIPHDWPIYIGVDSGSGGKFNHPSAVSFVAMKPDMQYGVVFKGKRFDGYTMTNSDLVAIVRDMKEPFGNQVAGIFYDYSATDLFNIASQMGETWIPAEKSHIIGEQYINVGFKNQMLQIFNIDELSPMVGELKSLKLTTPKNQAHDDAIDSMRYAITKIPWDWSNISAKPLNNVPREKDEFDLRREFISSEELIDHSSMEYELDAYQDLLGDF